MAQSSGPASLTVPGMYKHSASGVTYKIDDAGHVRFPGTDKALAWHIGSGSAGQSFLYTYDGFLFQAPLTWYAQRGVWDASPGYDRDPRLRWNRPVDANCLFCHASQTRPIYRTDNRFADPPFLQAGVGCERCHGPGSDHVQRKGSMVNPAALEAGRRDAVCSQCHLSGEARVEKKDRGLAMYRPGERLSDYVTYFIPEDSMRNGLRATGYVEKLAASVCKKASGDRLWCGTCHDPHSVPVPSRTADFFRSKCMQCHSDTQCARGPDCRTCHMPRARAVDGGHGVLTDHSILKTSVETADKPQSWKLTTFAGYEASSREFGLAYAETGVRNGSAEQMKEAVRLLSTVPLDTEVTSRLIDLYLRGGDPKTAYKLCTQAELRPAASVSILVNCGVLEGEQGNMTRAAELWRKALKRNPGLTEAAVNLERSLQASDKDTETARRLESGSGPR